MKRNLAIILSLLLFTSIVTAQTVYITKTGSKYHSSGCGSLSKSKIKIELKDALDRGYTACSKCSPPTEVKSETDKKSDEQKESTITPVKKETKVESDRCIAITKKGTQCKRKAEPGSKYCWQHQK